jgi:hypothetical protein
MQIAARQNKLEVRGRPNDCKTVNMLTQVVITCQQDYFKVYDGWNSKLYGRHYSNKWREQVHEHLCPGFVQDAE